MENRVKTTSNEELKKDFNKLINNVATNVVKTVVIKDGETISKNLEISVDKKINNLGIKVDKSIEGLVSKNSLYINEFQSKADDFIKKVKLINGKINDTSEKSNSLLLENVEYVKKKLENEVNTAVNSITDKVSKSEANLENMIINSKDVLNNLNETIITTSKQTLDESYTKITEIQKISNEIILDIKLFQEEVGNIRENFSDINKNYKDLTEIIKVANTNLNSLENSIENSINKNDKSIESLSFMVNSMKTSQKDNMEVISKLNDKTLVNLENIKLENDKSNLNVKKDIEALNLKIHKMEEDINYNQVFINKKLNNLNELNIRENIKFIRLFILGSVIVNIIFFLIILIR